jgi:hypothetical protein
LHASSASGLAIRLGLAGWPIFTVVSNIKTEILMMKKFILAFFMFLASAPGFAAGQSTPPELWSWFKDMNKSAQACDIQSAFVLQKLNIENITKTDYGIYGTLKGNRIVVKCLEMGKKSKLWVAVAGNDRDSVELLRNTLVKEIN